VGREEGDSESGHPGLLSESLVLTQVLWIQMATFTICVFFPQYIHPADAVKLGQAELVVIDEAAAIPLPLVKSLLGPYLVFMASTING